MFARRLSRRSLSADNVFLTFKFIVLLFILLSLLTSCSSHSHQIRRAERLYKEGQVLAAEGQEEEAILKFERSITLARKAGFSAGEAHNFNELAIIYTSKGDYVQARQLLNKAIEIYRSLKMEPEVSKCLSNIALTYVREHDFEEALKRYRELLNWDRATNNYLGMAITLNNMGLILDHFLGKQEEAQRHYSQALEIFEELGNEKYIKAVKKNMAPD